MPHLPTHPSTGSEDVPPDAPDAPDTPEMTSHGFPKKTPVEDMTPDQQVAYWKYHARKHETAVKAYGGKTPQQIAELESQLTTLQTERMSAEEKAIADAVSKATEATRAEVAQEWQGKYQHARVEAIAGRFLEEEDGSLESFMAIVDTSKFLGKDGDIDKDVLVGHLTAIYGKPKTREFGYGLPQHRNWGQHGSPPPLSTPGAAGRAEAARRRGEKPPNQ